MLLSTVTPSLLMASCIPVCRCCLAYWLSSMQLALAHQALAGVVRAKGSVGLYVGLILLAALWKVPSSA